MNAKKILEVNQAEVGRHESMLLADDFSFSRSLLIADTTWIRCGRPYLYGATHAIHVLSGTADYEINLRHYDFGTGDVAIISANSILQMNAHSADYRIQAVSLKVPADVEPHCLHVAATPEGSSLIAKYFDLIGATIDRGFDDRIIDSLTAALRLDILRLYNAQTASVSTANTRGQDIFNRFLSLVSRHSANERSIAFYADRLFLSPRYLSTVIKQVSGRSPMAWVDLSVMNKAKIALAYTDRSIAQIAHDLGFDEQTTFTRFFRRTAGTTPSDFRRSK